MQSPCEVFSRSDDAVIRVYNRGGDPVQTREDELNLTGEISSRAEQRSVPAQNGFTKKHPGQCAECQIRTER